MEKFLELGFIPCDILLPKTKDFTKWSVVACDQYTSQPDYWDKVKETAGDNLSTLNMIYPEIYLNEENGEKRIENINNTMKEYLDKIMDFCKKSIGSGITVELRLWNFDRESIYDKNQNGIVDNAENIDAGEF